MGRSRVVSLVAQCLSRSAVCSRLGNAAPLATLALLVPSTKQHASMHYLAQPCGDRLLFGGLASTCAPGHGCGEQRRSMFIQTQPTPNPHSLMFMPGQKVMENGSHEFTNARAGLASPLAKRLFAIDGVTTVLFGSDFITVTKQDDASWSVLKPLIFSAVMDHYGSGQPLFTNVETLAQSENAILDDDDEVVAMIKELLETRIRPAVQEDGGDITYRAFDPDTGVVTVKMMGACSGCPSSTVTLKSGIENMLMHYIPEVKRVVEAGPDAAEQLGLQEFVKLDAQLEPQDIAAANKP